MTRRAVIVASGDLPDIPAEAQDIANILSAAGWIVHLCSGADASRAGLARAANEGGAALAWIDAHADERGFGLADGVLPAADLGAWLAQIGAGECVLNTCYSLEHVTAIQRAAPVGVACTIDRAGVGDALARVVGVSIARCYVETGDMARAVREAAGSESGGYRYIPRGGRRGGGTGGMGIEDQELLRQLVAAIRGDGMTGAGLIVQWQQLANRLDTFMIEERRARLEQERVNDEHERRLAALEGGKPVAMTERSIYIGIIAVVAVAVLLLVATLLLDGGLR